MNTATLCKLYNVMIILLSPLSLLYMTFAYGKLISQSYNTCSMICSVRGVIYVLSKNDKQIDLLGGRTVVLPSTVITGLNCMT